jgi:hypothetical protein
MRTLPGVAIAVLVATVAASDAAIIYPWCTTGAGHDYGAVNCGFNTFEQCLETARGNGQGCQPNPLYQNSGQPAARPSKRGHTRGVNRGG